MAVVNFDRVVCRDVRITDSKVLALNMVDIECGIVCDA